MFLTKHPHRYTQLSDAGKLIEQDNFWYGSYLSDERTPFLSERYHTFGYIYLSSPQASPCALPEFEWIIVGCDTPVFKHDEPPSRTAIAAGNVRSLAKGNAGTGTSASTEKF